MKHNLNLLPSYGNLFSIPELYHCFIGCLLYLTVTRLDICLWVNHLSRFMRHPRSTHFEAVFRVLGYLKVFIDCGILLSSKISIYQRFYRFGLGRLSHTPTTRCLTT